jgi:hypothetical protein
LAQERGDNAGEHVASAAGGHAGIAGFVEDVAVAVAWVASLAAAWMRSAPSGQSPVRRSNSPG